MFSRFLKKMGSTPTKHDASNTAVISRQIDNEIKKEKMAGRNVVKMLLLGPSNSGKSTIFKQMKILHLNGFQEGELRECRELIHRNLIRDVYTLVKAMPTINVEFENPARKADVSQIVDLVEARRQDINSISAEIAESLQRLWADESMKKCFQKVKDTHIPTSSEYFLNSIDRLCSLEYTPTEQDILYTRLSTFGVTEINFPLKGIKFVVIDVGGQRTERKKWIHHFESVNCVLFTAAISEYDLNMAEDQKTNRMIDALQLFETITESRWFRKTSVILFLNKTDIFRQKIRSIPITVTFPDYTGSSTYEETSSFIQKQFSRRFRQKAGQMYCHFTCATDTDQIKFVLSATMDIIIMQNMKSSGVV